MSASCAKNNSTNKLVFVSLAWQEQTLKVHKQIVEEWNNSHRQAEVEYVQSNWSSIHDYLITSFETGDVPDIFHYESSTIIDFGLRGNLVDLNEYLSEEIKNDIHPIAWESVRMKNGLIIGVPFIFESMIVLYNKKHFKEAGIEVPALENPWSWEDLKNAAVLLTKDYDSDGITERYGAAMGLRNSANILLNLGLSFGCNFFNDVNGELIFDMSKDEKNFLSFIKEMIYTDHSISPVSVTQSGPGILPSFFNEKFSMVIGIGTWARQQLIENAPEGFEWGVLPPIKGASQEQASNTQTLSIPKDSKHKKNAAEFIEFFLNKENMSKLAKSDWMTPARKSLINSKDFCDSTYGWNVCSYMVDHLVIGDWLKYPGYAEWKGRVANPLFQEFFSNRLSIDDLELRMKEESDYVLSRYRRWIN